MKKLITILILSTTLLTSGCFIKEKNLEQMIFPISLALAYENNKFQIYLQVLNTSTLSILEIETSQSDSSYVIIKAEDESISKAFNKLGLKSLTYISAIKLKSIVLHKSIFESPINYDELCMYFINSPIFRTKVQMFYTNTKIEDFYSVQYMLVGSSVFSHTNEEEPQIIRGYSTASFLLDTLKSYYDLNRMYHFPIMDVKEENISQGDKDGKLKPVKTYYYNGTCFSTYDEEKIKCLSKEEALGTRYYNELEYINEDIGTNSNPINIIINKINWKTKITNDNFNITLELKVHINLNNTSLSINEIKEKFNNKIKKDIKNTLSIAYQNNIDIYHLNDYALRKNKNITYNLENTYINIDTKIQNSTYYKY